MNVAAVFAPEKCLYHPWNQLLLKGLCRIADTPLGGEASMTVRTDHHSDFDPAQLVLYGAAAIILFVYAWTLVP